MQNLVQQKAEKRDLCFYVYTSLFLGSALFLSSVSAAMVSCDRELTIQTRDKAIKKALSFCFSNPGEVAVIYPLVQSYDDGMRTFFYDRPLNRELSLRVPISGPRRLIENYTMLTDQEQEECQKQLKRAVTQGYMLDVENALKNGACATGFYLQLFDQQGRAVNHLLDFSLIQRFTEEEFDLAIPRLLFAEKGVKPSADKVLRRASNEKQIKFALEYGEKASAIHLEFNLVVAVSLEKPQWINMLLEAGADIYAARSHHVLEKNVCKIVLDRVYCSDGNGDKNALGALEAVVGAGGFDSEDIANIISPTREIIIKGQQKRENHIRQCLSETYPSFAVDIIARLTASCFEEEKLRSAPDQLLLK